jgi:hypothetical protein
MAVEVKENGDVVVNTGRITKGGFDNPRRAVAYGRFSTGSGASAVAADGQQRRSDG